MNPIRNGVAAPKVVRCAIYTRKSTEEGLDQEFNSLDAQREAEEAYIASQEHQGWLALPGRRENGTGWPSYRRRAVLSPREQHVLDIATKCCNPGVPLS
jgi:hypothetical protein